VLFTQLVIGWSGSLLKSENWEIRRNPAEAGLINSVNTIAHGIDLVECTRLQEVIDRHGERFLKRIFTPGELDYCDGRKRSIEHLAARFAAKEAVMKVLGTGWTGGIRWTDIEVSNDPAGRPEIQLTGKCSERASQLGIDTVLISITHTAGHAMASAIGCGKI
jgi:holo-[acyl-carrier protein] synthase